MAAPVYAGIQDRFSDIDLLPSPNVIQAPEISAPSTSPPANEAWLYVIDENGKSVWVIKNSDGDIVSINTGAYRYVDLPLTSFTTVSAGEIEVIPGYKLDSGINTFDPHNATQPYLDADAVSPALVWHWHHPLAKKDIYGGLDDGPDTAWSDIDQNYSTSPALVTFRLPANYRSGLALELWADQMFEGSTNANVAIEYEYYRHQDRFTFDSIMDSVATREAPRHLDHAGNGWASPTQVILTTSETFAAGDLVTFLIWRRDDWQIVDDLRILNIRARYVY